MLKERAGPGLVILIGAVIAGIAGELLFVDAGWGVGASMWIMGLGLLGMGLKSRWKQDQSNFNRLMFLPFIVLAFCLSWRDALFLNIATIIGLITVFGLMMQSSQIEMQPGRSFMQQSGERKTPGLMSTVFRSVVGLSGYFRSNVDWGFWSPSLNRTHARSMLKGVLLAAPCLVVYGVLLSLADHEFGALMGNLIDIDMPELTRRMATILFFAFISGAYLYGLLSKLSEGRFIGKEKQFSLSMLEVGIILGLINVLFFIFVAMQMGYLFGGAEYVEEVVNRSSQYYGRRALKDYTRKGFFELVAVAALALPLLMGLRRFFKPARHVHNIQFNTLANMQIGLLLMMLVSAAQRMWLYVSAFGITELRLYSSVFMVWLAFVLGWFAWTSLRGFAINFVRGSALAGVFIVLGLNLVTPDSIIVNSNLNRAIKGMKYDVESLKDLNADAIPAIIDKLPGLPIKEQELVSESLKNYSSNRIEGWRDWNHAKHVAEKLITEEF